jgi:carnosine N-methyltransferase
MSESDDAAELQHFDRVIAAFRTHGQYQRMNAERVQDHWSRVPEAMRRAAPKDALSSRLNGLRAAADLNHEFLEEAAALAWHCRPVSERDAVPLPPSGQSAEAGGVGKRPRTQRDLSPEALHDLSRVSSTLHSVAREWTAEGAGERAQSLGVIVDELVAWLPLKARNERRVLVPGVGTGRLLLEVCAAGYRAQGNEFSYHMLFAAGLMLNGADGAEVFRVCPFVDQPSNARKASDVWRSMGVPDVDPRAHLDGWRARHAATAVGSADDDPPADMSLAAGDFLVVYSGPEHQGAWDAVVTCFFLDTAPVIMDYVAHIASLLPVGGYWINLGPLLYHWAAATEAGEKADSRYEQSIELSWEEVRHVLVAFGFDIVKEEWKNDVRYTCNTMSMMRTHYDCVLFVARKTPKANPS